IFVYSYDCGVFVQKFLSAVDNEILWKDTKYFENLPQYRKSTMLDLLKWEKNSMKVFSKSFCFVLVRARDKYGGIKG
ncbi:hypothetical protein KSS87_012460, partial [Heliosperma pusillum]